MAAALFTPLTYAHERELRRIPTPFVEDDRPVSPVLATYKPSGSGPFPILVFNHGSTGTGGDPAAFPMLFDKEDFARFFTERGWMVAFPQRRGRGGSEGAYDEGFTKTRSAYSCDAEHALPGVDRALADIDIAVQYLATLSHVDAKRLVIGGQSRGGVLAIAYAGSHPQKVAGAINYVGGWISDRCAQAELINASTFKRGAGFRGSTLWLYAENDAFYGLAHSRRNYAAFAAAGGIGDFVVFDLGPGTNGHRLIDRAQVWRQAVETYLKHLR